MQPNNFAWNFAITDATTVRHVKETFIPRLRANIAELEELERICRAHGEGQSLSESIHDKHNELDAAEARLRSAELL